MSNYVVRGKPNTVFRIFKRKREDGGREGGREKKGMVKRSSTIVLRSCDAGG